MRELERERVVALHFLCFVFLARMIVVFGYFLIFSLLLSHSLYILSFNYSVNALCVVKNRRRQKTNICQKRL